MKLKKLELENYKSHKNYAAEFTGNSIVQGSKGSGKTSLKDAFTWLLTGKMVDDPTPVDDNGETINHLTISVACEFEDGTGLKIESQQRWVKDVLRSRHNSTYFVNDTPMLEKDYQAYLDEHIGTLEQRRILLDPAFFAYGDGLRVAGKTSKTATQRRREIVIGVAGAESLENDIAKNEETAKQAKFAISQLKKELDDANAGIESLHNAKVDVSHLNVEALKEQIKTLEDEKEQTIQALNTTTADDVLQLALNNATMELSNARSKYTLEYNERLEVAQRPLQEFREKQRILRDKIENINLNNRNIENREKQLLKDITELENNRIELLKEYKEIENEVYSPDSVICQCCGQVLPQDKLREHEARFNKQRSDRLEKIIALGKDVASDLEHFRKQLEILEKPIDTKGYENELASLIEPIVEVEVPFESTPEYIELQNKVIDAQKALRDKTDDDVKALYQRTLDNISLEIQALQDDLNKFSTNNHLDKQIELKGEELQKLAEQLDTQQDILEGCNEFTRKTLQALETTLEEKFEGIRFKMFEYTLDGDQKDTCITYAKTDVGYIPWESLSGGQKRSATIKLANAFSKAWNVKLPLWIDDTQIYSEDEISAVPQLIRITEVPHMKLEVK